MCLFGEKNEICEQIGKQNFPLVNAENFDPQFFHMFGDSVYAYHDFATDGSMFISINWLIILSCYVCLHIIPEIDIFLIFFPILDFLFQFSFLGHF